MVARRVLLIFLLATASSLEIPLYDQESMDDSDAYGGIEDYFNEEESLSNVEIISPPTKSSIPDTTCTNISSSSTATKVSAANAAMISTHHNAIARAAGESLTNATTPLSLANITTPSSLANITTPSSLANTTIPSPLANITTPSSLTTKNSSLWTTENSSFSKTVNFSSSPSISITTEQAYYNSDLERKYFYLSDLFDIVPHPYVVIPLGMILLLFPGIVILLYLAVLVINYHITGPTPDYYMT